MILVTGGTGFIGGHLLEKLGGAGEPVRCLLRRDPRRPLPPGVETVRGDLLAPQGLDAALRGVDTVIHLAGVTKALRPADYYAGNLRATENLAVALQGRPIRLVHVSSMAAAGPGKALVEDAEPRPVSHYGCSKLEAERVVRALLPEAVIVRPPVVYGPRDADVYQILKSVAKGITRRDLRTGEVVQRHLREGPGGWPVGGRAEPAGRRAHLLLGASAALRLGRADHNRRAHHGAPAAARDPRPLCRGLGGGLVRRDLGAHFPSPRHRVAR